MGLQVVGTRTLVFRLIDICPCGAHAETVRKHLQKLDGTGSVAVDIDEGKVTIEGTNSDPSMVILALKTIKVKAEPLTGKNSKINQLEEKKDTIHPTKAPTVKAVPVVVCKAPANNQVLDGSGLRTSSHFHSKQDHEHGLKLKNYNKSRIGNARAKKVQNHLQQIDGTGSVAADADKGKINIKGTNLDPNKVISQRKTNKKGAKLLKGEADNQVRGKSALQISQYSHSKDDHEHELKIEKYKKRFRCNRCKEEGIGPRYRCKHCDYEVHPECMDPKPTISHELCEGSIFEFSRDKPRKHRQSCEACGTKIRGCAYHCKTKGLSLHPACANVKGKLGAEGATFTLKKKAPGSCILCCDDSKRGTGHGWAYVSEDNKFEFHVNCMTRIAYEAWDYKAVESDDDAYQVVLGERLNSGLIKHSKRKRWSKCRKILEMTVIFIRTILGIFLGDPTVILASTLLGVLKK